MAIQDDPIEGARRRFRMAMDLGVAENPDQAASDQREAQARGVSVPVLRDARASRPLPPLVNFHDLEQNAPRTMQFLSEPARAAVAHDDIDSLRAAETTVSGPSFEQRLNYVFGGGSWYGMGERAARSGFYGAVGDVGRRAPGAIGEFLGAAIRGNATAGARIFDNTALEPFFQDAAEFGRTVERGGRNVGGNLRPGEGRGLVSPIPQSRTDTGFTGDVFAGLGQVVGQAAVAGATRGLGNIPATFGQGVALMDDRVQAQRVLDGRVGADYTAQEDLALLGGGALTGITEQLGLNAITRALPAPLRARVTTRLGDILTAGLTEGVTESVESVGNNALARYLIGEDTSLVDGTIEEGSVATVVGSIARAVFATAIPGRQARAAEFDANLLEGLSRVSEASRLRERSPSTFAQFLDQVAEGSPVENVFVEASVLAAVLNQSGVDPNALAAEVPALAGLAEAVATGGDIRMSVGEFAAHIAPTDAGTPLLEHLRTSALGMSRAQAADFIDNFSDTLAAEVDKAIATTEQAEVFTGSRDAVEGRIVSELSSLGRFTQDVNTRYAALFANFYAVMGQRRGLTAEQMAEKYPIKFASQLPQSKGRSTLDQDSEIELVHWSAEQGLMRTDPSRWGRNRIWTSRAEQARKAAGAPGRTYFGMDEGQPGGYQREGFFATARRYTAKVAASDLYDFDADPLNLRAGKNATEYELAIQQAGYKGYSTRNPELGRVAAVFEPLDLEGRNPSAMTPEQEAALDQRAREIMAESVAAEVAKFGPRPGAGYPWPGRPLTREEARQQALAEQEAATRLEGAPASDKPFLPARRAAETYMARAKLRYQPPTQYAKIDKDRAARLAQAFEDMVHNPEDPETKASYRALADELMPQWYAIRDTGLEIEFIDFEKTGDPYAASPRMAIDDVRENNHLWVFPSDDGFGSEGDNYPGNPLLEYTDEYIGGRRLRVNDIFRIVHDYYGHIKEGTGFRAAGEENAWQSHAAMFSPLARRAMTTETRGQNSWVNFGPHAEFNRTASAGETRYAPQKIGLLPEWASEEGFLGGPDTGRGPAVLNIGLLVGKTKTELKLEDVVETVKAGGGQVVRVSQRMSSTEMTAIIELEAPLTAEAIERLTGPLKQEAIPQRFEDGTGVMYGPMASEWGPFNADYFLDPQEPTAPKPGLKTDTPEFKAWFGDSVVRDQNGEPLVVYHGTPYGEISEFKESEIVGPPGAVGFFFSADPSVAGDFALDFGRTEGPAPATVPVYLSIQNPARLNADVMDEMTITEFYEGIGLTAADVPEGVRDQADEPNRVWLVYKQEPEVFRDLIARGFDGFVARERGADVWVAFRPEQIKSVFNRGTFDANDPRILYQSPAEHPDRISTRLPTTKGAAEDAIADKLVVSVEAMGRKRSVLEHNAELVAGYPGVGVSGTADQKAEAFVQHVKTNLLALYDRTPEETRSRAKLWYDGARRLTTAWSGRYGLPDRSVAAAIAALSPQKDWYQNVSLAERVMDVWAKRQDHMFDPAMDALGQQLFAKYPELLAAMRGKALSDLQDPVEAAAFIRIYDQTYNPAAFRVVSPEGPFLGNPSGKVAWGSLVEIAKAVTVLTDQSFPNVSSALGAKHKVRNFYNNILSPQSDQGDVTIDTHAVAAGLLRPLSGSDAEVFHNFGSSPMAGKQPEGWVAAKNANEFGVSGTYAFYADAYRLAAAERGITAREMQSITWEAVRGLFSPAFKRNKANSAAVNEMWAAHARGETSMEDTINGIIEFAGGIAAPTWAGPGRGMAEAERQASYDGDLSRASLPGRGTGSRGDVGAAADPAARTFFQSENPPFYSALARAVEQSSLTKAPAAQWKATLSKTPGVKKEELDITGLNEWLDLLAAGDETAILFAQNEGMAPDAKGNISREAVLSFVRAGGVQLEEVVLGGEPVDTGYSVEEWGGVGVGDEVYYVVVDVDGDRVGPTYETEEEAEFAVEELYNGGAGFADTEGPAQFSGYSLRGEVPGSYREFLLRLPMFKGEVFESAEGHFSGFDDIIGHVRFAEYPAANGKRTLVLNEVQSTHHEQGASEGYKTDASPEQIEEARAAAVAGGQRLADALASIQAAAEQSGEASLSIFGESGGNPVRDAGLYDQRRFYESLTDRGLASPEVAAAVAKWRAASLAKQEADLAFRTLSRGIPDAPWKKSWDALLMKRVIRYAVDHGFEQIAWINGNQQNGGQTGGDGSWFYERNLVNVTNEIVKKYGVRVEPVDFTTGYPKEQAAQGQKLVEELKSLIAEETDLDQRAELTLTLADAEQDIADIVRPATELGIQNGFTITPELREAASQGFAMFQPNRGQIAFGADITQTTSVITLLPTADLSTFLHETGHFFLEVIVDMAKEEGAPADVRRDADTILSWFDKDMTLAKWNAMSLEQRRPYHEKFARGFEAYLFEGKSPSRGMRDLFRTFSAWLKSVYKSLRALNVELTDDVRGVLDRMVASEEEIKAAEAMRSLAPVFDTKPEGLSEFEWEEYQALGRQATDDAVEALERRSARDMRWASGAKDRYVRQLQAEAREQRKAVRAEVTAEVSAEPVNRARLFLRRGLGPGGNPVENAGKLDLASLKAQYGDKGEWTKLRRGGRYGEVGENGLHPDAVAEMFGYPSGAELIADLVNAENPNDKINGLTDQRMLERYGDLTDADAIERAANEAVANDARAKFVAAEMSALDKAVGKRSILIEAARDYAAKVVNGLQVRRLRPAQYLAAQDRAAKAAEKAVKADDLVAAAAAKRNQLINLHTARAVQKAQTDVEKTVRLFTRIVSGKDDALQRTRNMDLVNAARAVLMAYGFGRVKNNPQKYMDALKRYDPSLYADLAPFLNGALGEAKPIGELTYEQFQGLRDTVGQLWTMSRRVRQIEIDGQLLDQAVVAEALEARIQELGVPEDVAGVTRDITNKDRLGRKIQGVRASLRRVESWARGLDGGDIGPFRRYIWNPVSVAADRYRAESNVYLRRFRELIGTVRDQLTTTPIPAPELGYTFLGKASLYHALLHTGNGSNKSKLLIGRGWGRRDADGMLDDSAWQSFIDRLHSEGVLTKRDWDFVQSVWLLLEDTKPGAQKAHRAMYGRYFDEVSADPVETPFGTYAGGYVPALTEAYMVQDAVLRAEEEALEGGASAMFPAASNGFTKSRVEDYTRELSLDLSLLPAHIDKVLKFTHLGPPVRDVVRLLKHRGLSKSLQALDPVAQTDLLLPWLQRAAKQTVETAISGSGGAALDSIARVLRARTGMQLMFANVVNTAQQITGFSGVFLRVEKRRVAGALWRVMRDPKGVADAVTGLSVFMDNRMSSEVFETRKAINQAVTLNPSAREKAVDFAQQHAYFLQTSLQNAMDLVTWSAAYDKAVERGDNDVDAVRFADSVIRETQGTFAPEDVSRFETGTPAMRMFTQFYGYFNMLANLNATEVQLVARSIGVRKGAGRLFYIYLFGFAVPALLGELIAVSMRGGFEDDEEDGYLDEMLAWFFGSQTKFALAAVPGVGQVANAAIGATTKVPYDDRVSLSPAVSTIEASAGVPAAVYKSVVEGESFNRTDVRDTFTLLGLISGTPLGALGRPVGYATGVAQGEIEPTSAADAARGFVTGAPSPESRQ